MLIAKLTAEPARVIPEAYMTWLGGTQAAGIIIAKEPFLLSDSAHGDVLFQTDQVDRIMTEIPSLPSSPRHSTIDWMS